MTAKKKGPAEAATSPSHGSNNPRKGNAVNRQHDTTTVSDAATFDPFAFSERLFDLKMLAASTAMLANGALFEEGARIQGLVAITPHEAELIAFLIDQVLQKADAAVEAFKIPSIIKTSGADLSADPSRSPTMRDAIDAHRVAFEALGPLYSKADGKDPTAKIHAAVEAADAREEEAKTALMRARPSSLEEEAERMEYLFGFTGPWRAFAPTEQEGADLVASLRSA